MIIGRGAIAKALDSKDRDDRLYFCSGVANSKEVRYSEFDREADLLAEQSTNRHIIYFSTLSVFWADTPYTRHKRSMEQFITDDWDCYTIVRIGNIEWATNPHQLIPFIRNKLKNNEDFPLFDEYRHILSKEEFLYWIDRIPQWNCEMNIPGRRIKVGDLVFEIRQQMRKKNDSTVS